MADFIEIIEIGQKMCRNNDDCSGCPMLEFIYEDVCPFVDGCFRYNTTSNLHDIENKIQEWAAEHPEPKYPTWFKWWEQNFSGTGAKMFSPCSFASPQELGCSSLSDKCMRAPFECWHKPIPAHIAEKLGVKPLKEGE